MAQITIKLEGITNISKLFDEKGRQIIDGGEKVIKQHMDKVLNSARSKIHSVSGETAESLKAKVSAKRKTYVTAEIGTIDGTKEEAIRANSLEYGHAFPGQGRDSIGVRKSKQAKSSGSVPAHPFIRPAIDEDKRAFKTDMKNEIQKVIERG
jgi:hypothetical protein